MNIEQVMQTFDTTETEDLPVVVQGQVLGLLAEVYVVRVTPRNSRRSSKAFSGKPRVAASGHASGCHGSLAGGLVPAPRTEKCDLSKGERPLDVRERILGQRSPQADLGQARMRPSRTARAANCQIADASEEHDAGHFGQFGR